MNILFIIGTLEGGGAARVLVNLANYFSELEGYSVNVISHRRYCAYPMSKDVTHSVLYEDHSINKSYLNKTWRRVNYLYLLTRNIRKAKPDSVVVFLRGMNWRIILLGKLLGLKVIATEHTNYLAERGFWSWVERRFIYKLAYHVTVLTKFDHDKYYSKYLKSVHVVPNPLSFARRSSDRQKVKRILAAGDLNRWSTKGFDILLRVFANLHLEYPGWRLSIAGPGEEGKKILNRLAKDLGIFEKIDFMGFVPHLDREMQTSSIFALSSRYEGFSMVLVEAMSQGCACISFACTAGPPEIIEDRVSGLLIEDQNMAAFESGLRRLMGDEELRRNLGNKAIDAVKRFQIEEIAPVWINLFKN